MRGLETHINEVVISRVLGLPMALSYEKDEIQPTSNVNKLFYKSYEEPKKEKEWSQEG